MVPTCRTSRPRSVRARRRCGCEMWHAARDNSTTDENALPSLDRRRRERARERNASGRSRGDVDGGAPPRGAPTSRRCGFGARMQRTIRPRRARALMVGRRAAAACSRDQRRRRRLRAQGAQRPALHASASCALGADARRHATTAASSRRAGARELRAAGRRAPTPATVRSAPADGGSHAARRPRFAIRPAWRTFPGSTAEAASAAGRREGSTTS